MDVLSIRHPTIIINEQENVKYNISKKIMRGREMYPPNDRKRSGREGERKICLRQVFI